MDKFKIYYDFLIEENKKYDLTNITEYEEVMIKHFQDSLALEDAINLDAIESIVDVGAGAGFPSIPLKIKHPHLKLTIIEPTNKRCVFLKELVCRLDLKDVIIVQGRAEDAIALRETFDIAIARAVARLNILLELCIPLVKKNGLFIAYKGKTYIEEINESSNALKELDSKVIDIYKYELDNGFGTHYLVKIKKNKETNKKYPRRYSQIKNNSL